MNVRAKMDTLKDILLSQPGAVEGDQPLCPLKHSFGDGLYVREIFIPKGFFGVTKIHKKTHPYFILKGKVRVVTEDGNITITAPFQGITLAGTRRSLIALEDTIWITVHATNETELDKIEEEIIAKDFNEIETLLGGTKCHTGLLDQ
jgi:hypothetical protein